MDRLFFDLESGQQILEEEYDENYEPTEEEILAYCKVLGLDPIAEKDLLFIAKEAIKAPLPADWRPVENTDGSIYYFNFKTGDSIWEHPCDEFYRKQLQQEREKLKRGNSRGMKKSGTGGGKKSRPNAAGKRSNANGLAPTVGGLGSSLGKLGNLPPPLLNSKQQNSLSLQGAPALQSAPSPALQNTLSLGAAPSLQSAPTLQNPAATAGRLMPLSLPGKGELSPLAPLSGLPLLKNAPASLAPLQKPLGQSLKGSSGLGESLTSTINGGQSSKVAEPLVNTGGNMLGKLGSVDLGSIRISNEYEEEEEESSEFDSEGSDSDLKNNGGFESKFGMNLLGAKDLGLKSSGDETTTEGLKKELHKVLELDGSGGDDSNISDRSATPDHPAATMGFGKFQLSPLSAAMPTANGSIGNSNEKPGHHGSSMLNGYNKKRSSSENPKASAVKTKTTSAAKEKTSLTKKATPSDATALSSKDLEEVRMEHNNTLKELKKVHTEELEKLHQELAAEMQSFEENAWLEKEEKVARLKQKLASEQLSEESGLKAEKKQSLDDLKKQLKEEEEEEEARLMEEKHNTLRKLRQKISVETDAERRELLKSKDLAIAKLKQEMEEERKELERTLRRELQEELEQLRESLKNELEEEKKSVEMAQKEELQILREESQKVLQEKREVLERKKKEDLENLQEQLEREHETAIIEVNKIASVKIEQVKSRVEESFKEAELEMRGKLDADLENKRSDLSNEHEVELNNLRSQLETKLREARNEVARKVEAERLKFETELSELRKVHTQEQQSTVQELQQEYETIKQEIESEKLVQLRMLEDVKLDYASNKEKLVRLQTEVYQEMENAKEKQQQGESVEAGKLLEQELREAITKERKTLAALRKSREELELEILELSKQKLTLEQSVDALEVKQSRQDLSSSSSSTTTTSTTTTVDHVSGPMVEEPTSEVDGEGGVISTLPPPAPQTNAAGKRGSSRSSSRDKRNSRLLRREEGGYRGEERRERNEESSEEGGYGGVEKSEESSEEEEEGHRNVERREESSKEEGHGYMERREKSEEGGHRRKDRSEKRRYGSVEGRVKSERGPRRRGGSEEGYRGVEEIRERSEEYIGVKKREKSEERRDRSKEKRWDRSGERRDRSKEKRWDRSEERRDRSKEKRWGRSEERRDRSKKKRWGRSEERGDKGKEKRWDRSEERRDRSKEKRWDRSEERRDRSEESWDESEEERSEERIDGRRETKEKRSDRSKERRDKRGGSVPKEPVPMDESWMEDTEESTAMSLQELEPSKVTQPNLVHRNVSRLSSLQEAEIEEYSLDSVRERLIKHQRELRRTLQEEKKSLIQSKEYLKQQQERLIKRQATLDQSYKEWNKEERIAEGEKLTKDSSAVLMKDIRSKLDQEAAALSELEERMRSSKNLLSLKEQAVSQLQASMDREVDANVLKSLKRPSMAAQTHFPGQRSVSAGPDRHLLHQHHQHLRQHRSKTSSTRKPRSSLQRHFSAQLASSSKPESRHVGVAQTSVDTLSSLMSSNSDSSSSSSVTDVKDRNHHLNIQPTALWKSPKREWRTKHEVTSARRWKPPVSLLNTSAKYKTLEPQLSSGDESTADSLLLDRHHHQQQQHHHQQYQNSAMSQGIILESLHTINSQLGQLLNRVGPNTDPSLPPPPPPLHHSLLSEGAVATGVSRWAEPTASAAAATFRGGGIHPALRMPTRNHSHLGHSSYTSASTTLTTASPSTEELVRSQTDWLKEFQQSVPPASQLRRASAGCLRPTSAPPSPPSSSVYPSARRREMSSVSTGLEPASSAALPRRPKLVLDDNNNIQLVHV